MAEIYRIFGSSMDLTYARMIEDKLSRIVSRQEYDDIISNAIRDCVDFMCSNSGAHEPRCDYAGMLLDTIARYLEHYLSESSVLKIEREVYRNYADSSATISIEINSSDLIELDGDEMQELLDMFRYADEFDEIVYVKFYIDGDSWTFNEIESLLVELAETEDEKKRREIYEKYKTGEL